MATVNFDQKELDFIVNTAVEKVKIQLDKQFITEIVAKSVGDALKRLPSVQPSSIARPEPSPQSEADQTWGYCFGVDGVMNAKEAGDFLSVSGRQLDRLAEANGIRKGKHATGVRCFCRRSVNEYSQSLEK